MEHADYMQQALAVQKRIGAHLHGEVIQIGAVKLNEAMEIIGSASSASIVFVTFMIQPFLLVFIVDIQ